MHKECKLNICNKTLNIGKFLFIEIVAPFTLENKEHNNFDLSKSLEKISKKINKSLDFHYTLRGLIFFTTPISKYHFAIGHYVSYCWRDHTKIWERYDDKNRNSPLKCQFLIYA